MVKGKSARPIQCVPFASFGKELTPKIYGIEEFNQFNFQATLAD